MLNTVNQAAGATGVSLVGMLGFSGHIFAAVTVLGGACIVTAGLLLGVRK
jgi:hypothetical protein